MNYKLRISPPLILTFVAIAEMGSVTKAAQQLNVTPTAISKQLKQLERELQQSLFERTTRHMRLTEFGELFYQQCLKVKNEITNTVDLAQSFQQRPRGRLSILCAEHLAEEYLLSRLKKFSAVYPEISYQIEIADRIPDSVHENVNIVIGFSQLHIPSSELRFKKLFTTQHVLCASPRYLRKYGTPKKTEDLMKHKFINHTLRTPASRLPLANKKFVQMNEPYLAVNSISALTQLCIDGMGMALLTHSVAGNYFKQKKLVPVLPRLDWQSIDVYLFYHYTAYEQPKIRAFIDFIQ